jgi:hypothetical protein
MAYTTSARLEHTAGAWEGSVRNISSDGLFVETARSLAAGEHLKVGFRMRHSRQTVDMAAVIARVTPEGIGVRIVW